MNIWVSYSQEITGTAGFHTSKEFQESAGVVMTRKLHKTAVFAIAKKRQESAGLLVPGNSGTFVLFCLDKQLFELYGFNY